MFGKDASFPKDSIGSALRERDDEVRRLKVKLRNIEDALDGADSGMFDRGFTINKIWRIIGTECYGSESLDLKVAFDYAAEYPKLNRKYFEQRNKVESCEAEINRLRDAYHELYAEANSWLTSDQPDRIQLLDAMHSKALKEVE